MPSAFGAFLILEATSCSDAGFDSASFSDSLTPMQLDLFTSVLDSYLHGGLLSNETLYGQLIERGAMTEVDLREKRAIGNDGQQHSPAKRRVRWIQQPSRA